MLFYSEFKMATIGGVTTRNVIKVNRIGAHSHIGGLGLSEQLEPANVSEGMVGQYKARRGAGIIVKMIKEGKIAGRAILIAGEPGTGKTALAHGISKALGQDTPFVSLSASEVFSVEMGKTEALQQAFRKAIGVKITEETEVLEGEVVSIEIDRPASGAGPKVGKMTLKTMDMEAIYDVGSKMAESCTKEKISPGDVVQIDKATGRVTRLGRSFLRQNDFDTFAPSTKFVQCPSGEIQKKSQSTSTVCIHDIDVINSRPQGYLALFAGDTGEVNQEVRNQIDKKMSEWREEGKARIVPGVIFIDEVHLLDLECFSFLNRALEHDLAPILVMATNKGKVAVRGTDMEVAHGIPADLLDRTLIVRTEKPTSEERIQIIRLRAEEEGVKMTDDAITVLDQTIGNTSIRYGMQLISLANVLRMREGNAEVTSNDIRDVYGRFLDRDRSALVLSGNADAYIS